MVLVPRIVREGYYFPGLGQEATEMFLLFVSGVFGLILFNWKDIRLRRIQSEHEMCSRDRLSINKDLATSYTYIGALNRKVDILKEIILTLPKELYIKRRHEGSPYDIILEAIEVFSECPHILMGFYRCHDGEMMFEVALNSKFRPKIDREDCVYSKAMGVVYKKGYMVIRSAQQLQGYSAYCILKRNHMRDQDLDIIKALIVQGLFLYVSSTQKRRELEKFA